MQLRRAALPLSLLALLASAGCVSVGPESGVPGPARGSVPPLDAPDVPDPEEPSDGRRPAGALPELPLPLGEVPGAESRPEPRPTAVEPAGKARPPAERRTKPAAPRRVRLPAPPRNPRKAVPRPPGAQELCAAAEGTVPPSVVDLCLRQFGR
ncbi:hypothetical protein OOK31_14745 [Streptomyces sp. NBC_00249]|uniref:hypothetical protein n=1 Tax=Streptomyces sp. NBC_00249 TaxID=2975690 RepID=UPI002254A36A|nr:hypothetical protein [Streptomyces sp. NBC_00249]MCX5195143.1 hypothetical protein [Streptomyces sp. NBC_00249]